MIVASLSKSALQQHNRGSFAIVARITVFVVSVWVVSVWVVGRRVKERKERKTEVIENNDLVETVEATKSIIPIEVTIVETVEATKPIIPIEVTIVKTAEVTKPIIPIEVAVVETVEVTKPIEVAVARTLKAGGGAHHGSAVHRHPRHRSTAPPHLRHLRRRSRDRENARHHATEENEFFPVHNFTGFVKLKTAGTRKLR
jgi:hypothetical protein